MKRLVIIDDEYLTISGVTVMLEKINADYETVGSACDGISALTVIREKKPDLVIIDIRMPGMNGLEVIELAKQEFPDMIFALLSGYQEFEYARKGLNLGVKEYIDKPITREKLTRLLEKVDLELEQKSYDAAIMKRKTAEQQWKLQQNAIIESINDSNVDGWKEKVEQSLKLLRESEMDLADYKTECYHLVVHVTEAFYEKWKQYERQINFPFFHNVEELKGYEEVDEYVYMIFERIFQKIAVWKIGSSHRIITQILSYMNENYGKDFGLNEMAEMIGLNNTYLSILFKAEVGTTFIKYLTKVRIEHAKELLLEGYKVNKVSAMVGYNNYHYFCNIFKREEGVTPMEYKGNVRKK